MYRTIVIQYDKNHEFINVIAIKKQDNYMR